MGIGRCFCAAWEKLLPTQIKRLYSVAEFFVYPGVVVVQILNKRTCIFLKLFRSNFQAKYFGKFNIALRNVFGFCSRDCHVDCRSQCSEKNSWVELKFSVKFLRHIRAHATTKSQGVAVDRYVMEDYICTECQSLGTTEIGRLRGETAETPIHMICYCQH